MDIESVKREFGSREHLYRQLKDEALFILEPAIGRRDIKLHSITHRIKSVESFLGKVQRKQSEQPFDDIQDIVGIRVICLFLSDIERIGKVIRESFRVLEEDNKVEGADVSSFGYMSFHFIAAMKSEHSGPRYDPIAQLPFEIQVRTIAMDAWANVSHYLDYKSDKDVPSELRRDFYALSGLFYVADRHFEMFFGSRKQSQERISELFRSPITSEQLEQEINLDSLTAYLAKKFPERRPGPTESISGLIEQLHACGYISLKVVDVTLSRGLDALIAFEKDTQFTYHRVGAARIAMSMVDENFLRQLVNLGRIDGDTLIKLNATYDKYRRLVN
jgi:ppGpp synthetase/RelA/SpoT-type nucleotidyltranferase